MFSHTYGTTALVIVFAVLTLDLIAIIAVWRPSIRPVSQKLTWTAAIVFLPAIGGLGWFLNVALGRATVELDQRRARR